MMFEMHKNILCESKNGKFKDEMGNSFWYLNGKLHREDGPAVEWSNQYKQWFINDVELTEEEFNQWLAKKQLKDNLFLFLDKRYEEKRTKI